MDDQVSADEHQHRLIGMAKRVSIFVDDDLRVTSNRSPEDVYRFGQFDEIGRSRKFEDNRGRFAFTRGVIQVKIRFGVLPGPWSFFKLALEARIDAKVFRVFIDAGIVGFWLGGGRRVHPCRKIEPGALKCERVAFMFNHAVGGSPVRECRLDARRTDSDCAQTIQLFLQKMDVAQVGLAQA